jgi:hypothetical protein
MAIFTQEIMMIQKNTSNRNRIPSTVISIALVSCLGLGVVLTTPQTLQAQVPENLAACLPTQTRRPIARVDNVASYDFEGVTYSLLSVFEEGESADARPTTLVVKTTGQGCEAVFFNPGGETVQLASVMPQTVARHLTLGLYEHQIDKIGIDKFKADILAVTRSETSITWFDEEIWALQQLGIPIPANVRTAPLPSFSPG